MSSWERHLTFKGMLEDNEPETMDDIDLEEQYEKDHNELLESITAYNKEGGY